MTHLLLPTLVHLTDRKTSTDGLLTATAITNAQILPLLNQIHARRPRRDLRHLINLTNPNLPLRRTTDGFTCNPASMDHPAVGVTWYGAAMVARAAGGRLPTTSERWSCCQEDEDIYPWGIEMPTPKLANFGHHHGGTTPVGLIGQPVNGIEDVTGNVYEWTCEPAADGISRATAGAGWSSSANELRIGHTESRLPLMASASCGFRIWLPTPAESISPQ
ncbi:MAG: formylglycine-generating enzyme family protein [Nocardioides sp.]